VQIEDHENNLPKWYIVATKGNAMHIYREKAKVTQVTDVANGSLVFFVFNCNEIIGKVFQFHQT
jgi:hypothetical protein